MIDFFILSPLRTVYVAVLFYFIRKLLVSYKIKIFMRTASKGRCHFVTLAGAAKCASHCVVVNSRKCAKHALFFAALSCMTIAPI